MPDLPPTGVAGPELRGFEIEAEMIAVLANPKRLMIVSLLGSGPRTVTEIAHHLQLSLQNTSQHLRVMRDRAIVVAHRSGREVEYSLSTPVISEACGLVRQALLADARTRQALVARADPPVVRPEAVPTAPADHGRRPVPVVM